jgi:hypothetical protein
VFDLPAEGQEDPSSAKTIDNCNAVLWDFSIHLYYLVVISSPLEEHRSELHVSEYSMQTIAHI